MEDERWNIETEPPLNKEEIEILARYNSEIARGIMHTETWQNKMFRLQAVFDKGMTGWPNFSRVKPELRVKP